MCCTHQLTIACTCHSKLHRVQLHHCARQCHHLLQMDYSRSRFAADFIVYFVPFPPFFPPFELPTHPTTVPVTLLWSVLHPQWQNLDWCDEQDIMETSCYLFKVPVIVRSTDAILLLTPAMPWQTAWIELCKVSMSLCVWYVCCNHWTMRAPHVFSNYFGRTIPFVNT